MGMGQVIDTTEFVKQIEKAIANGVATLDASAKVPKNQISLTAGDVGAQPLGNELTAIQSLADTAGFLRKTGDGTYSVDTSSYLPTTGGTLSGSLLIPNGTAAIPAIQFSGDTNTGIYRISEDSIGIATGGTAAIAINNSKIDIASTRFLEIDNTTASTSTTTGACIIAGGQGIGGDQWVGGNINGIRIGAGIDNTSCKVGFNAGLANTTGVSWSAFGTNSGLSNTTGGSWSAFGFNAGFASTTGGSWSAFGTNSGLSNTTGVSWSAFGANAGLANTTGNNWSAFGFNSGRFTSDGVTTLTVSNNSCFIGSLTKGTQNATNENVFGYNATGNGSNTTTIGDNNIIATYLRGAVNIPSTTPSTSTTTGALICLGGAGFSGAVYASSFNGSGSGLTALNASNITTGKMSYLRFNPLEYTLPLNSDAIADGTFSISSTTTEAGYPISGNLVTAIYSVARGVQLLNSTDGLNFLIRSRHTSFGTGWSPWYRVLLEASNSIRTTGSKTPASATATGSLGEICWDASYIYVCIATNTWKRTALTTW